MLESPKARDIVLHWIGHPLEQDSFCMDNKNNRIIVHGFKTGQKLEEVLARVHLAFGPLAVHRIGLSQATPLKVRRYLAHGIPTVIAYDDPDIPPNAEFVLRVPANDKPLEAEEVLEFIKRTASNNIRIKARIFAERTLDWTIKTRQLADFLMEVSHDG